MRGLNTLAPTPGKVVCLLALALLALSQVGSTPGPSCGGDCYSEVIFDKYSRANPHSRPTWSEDGTRIAFLHLGVIYVVASNGSSLTQSAGPDPDLDLLESPFFPGNFTRRLQGRIRSEFVGLLQGEL